MDLVTSAGPNDWESLPIAEAFTPLVLPATWRDITPTNLAPFGKAFVSNDRLRVLLSVEHKNNESRWLHVSISRQHKLPSWEDMKTVKDLFIGKDRTAIQIMPPANEYVNFHPYVMHLWSNLEKTRFVPDFRRRGKI